MEKVEINPVPNAVVAAFVLRQSNEKADSILVDIVYHEMTKRLAEKRQAGRGGWFGPNCTNKELLAMLQRNLQKGDMIDVINLAAMIYARAQLFGETA